METLSVHAVVQVAKLMNDTRRCSFQVFVTSMSRLGVRTQIKFTWYMNDLNWHSSMISSFRRKDSELVAWSGWQQKWILLFGSFQLFSHSDANTPTSQCEQSQKTNAWCSLAVFSYFLIFTPRHVIRTVIEVIWKTNTSQYDSSGICLFRPTDMKFARWSER
jgi:hypothetical protein